MPFDASAPDKQIVNAKTLIAWADWARPGASIVYHRGHIARDRAELVDGKHYPLEPVNEIAAAALQLAAGGALDLVQKRDSAGYLYIAQRRTKPAAL